MSRALAYSCAEHSDKRNAPRVSGDVALHFSSDLTWQVSSSDEHLFRQPVYEFMSTDFSPICVLVASRTGRMQPSSFLSAQQLQASHKADPRHVTVLGVSTDTNIAVLGETSVGVLSETHRMMTSRDATSPP
jgi:hypothetical protein